MTTPRQTIADQLIEDHTLKGYRVYPYPYLPSEVRKPVISVYRTAVDPSPDSPNKLRHPVSIDAFMGQSVGEAVEDAGDTLLDDIMLSLQRVPGLTFVSATRTVFGTEETGEFQGWSVKVYGDSANVYKSQVLTEGQ